MLFKVDFLKLPHETRAFTLVGAYMGYFALLEEGIGAAVGEVLGIKSACRAIVTRNMSFDDKIKTLRTLVNFYIMDKTLKKTFDEVAKRARKCGEQRNIVAHTPFMASNVSDGVQFLPVSASSKLEMPDMDWSIKDFLDHIDSINKIDNDLRSIEKRMPLQRIAEALLHVADAKSSKTDKARPIGGLFGLGASLLDDQKF